MEGSVATGYDKQSAGSLGIGTTTAAKPVAQVINVTPVHHNASRGCSVLKAERSLQRLSWPQYTHGLEVVGVTKRSFSASSRRVGPKVNLEVMQKLVKDKVER